VFTLLARFASLALVTPLASLVLVVAALGFGTAHAQEARPRERRAVREEPSGQRDTGRVDPRREERQHNARVREAPTSARSERRALPETRARKR
jgi:hypothetical protein